MGDIRRHVDLFPINCYRELYGGVGMEHSGARRSQGAVSIDVALQSEFLGSVVVSLAVILAFSTVRWETRWVGGSLGSGGS